MENSEFPDDYYVTEGEYQSRLLTSLKQAGSMEEKVSIIDKEEQQIVDLLGYSTTSHEYKFVLLNRLQINDNLRTNEGIPRKKLREKFLRNDS